MSPAPPSTFTLVGAGAVASSIGKALVTQGWRALGVIGRTSGSPRASALAKALESDAQVALDAAAQASDLVLLAVPDGQVSVVVEELAMTEVVWDGKTVLHTSGALTAAALQPLGDLGAALGAAHPLQSFAMPPDPAALTGIYVTVQGDEKARRVARTIFQAAGSKVLAITDEDKAAVHAAASVISNFTVTVSALARELLQTTSLGEQHVVTMLQPLLQGTVSNISEWGPDRALTGPIVRGDTETVARHVELIEQHAPHLMTVYVALATETVRLARKTARLSSSDAMDMLDTVINALPLRSSEDED